MKPRSVKESSSNDPEQLFWEWVQGCTKPKGWYRYSPEIARALGSDRSALVLSYCLHLDGHSSGYHSPGRWFYKSVKEFVSELCVPAGAVERALDILCIDWRPTERNFKPVPNARGQVQHNRTKPPTLGLLHRWFASRTPGTASGVFHYRVDWPRLAEWWKSIRADYGQLPLALKFVDIACQYGKKFHTGMAETPELVSAPTLNQYGLQPQSSVEDLHENTPEEDTSPGVDDAPAGAGEADEATTESFMRANDPHQLFKILCQANISSVTSKLLVEELAPVPLIHIRSTLSRIASEHIDVLSGKKRSTIRNWEGLKVSSLRGLIDQAKEGLLI
jgi:hypothetical protein